MRALVPHLVPGLDNPLDLSDELLVNILRWLPNDQATRASLAGINRATAAAYLEAIAMQPLLTDGPPAPASSTEASSADGPDESTGSATPPYEESDTTSEREP